MVNGYSRQTEITSDLGVGSINSASKTAGQKRVPEESGTQDTFGSFLNFFVDQSGINGSQVDKQCSCFENNGEKHISPNAAGSVNNKVGTEDISNLQRTLENALMASLASPNLAEKSKEPSDTTTNLTVTSMTERFLFGKNGLDTKDLLEPFNPLNNIPIISDLYGDGRDTEIGAFSSFLGSYLFAGNIGLAFSAADMISTAVTGRNLSENILDTK